jgi:hypothetical protein
VSLQTIGRRDLKAENIGNFIVSHHISASCCKDTHFFSDADDMLQIICTFAAASRAVALRWTRQPSEGNSPTEQLETTVVSTMREHL